MNALHYKVTDERSCAATRAIYDVLAIDKDGRKELLGMYIPKNEGANFWLNVQTDLQNRGVQDILIACVDALRGFADAIQSLLPDSIVHLRIIHQIRNSIKYEGSRHQKELLKDLKRIYRAVSKDASETELLNLEEKWGEKYPIVIKSWQDNGEKLTEYFQFTSAIRRRIYMTDTVEGCHRQIRKVTKNKACSLRIQPLKSLFITFIAIYARNGLCHGPRGQLLPGQLAIKLGDRFKEL